jgi:uncharacterized protein (TIGR03435 family)
MRPGIGKAAFLVLTCAAAFGQIVEAPAFEVASVKPAAPQANGRAMTFMRGGPGSPDPGQASFTNVSLMNLLIRAYDVQPFQVTGPSWLDAERYDVVAKVPPGTTKEQFRTMLQNLLAERFHVALHHESKEVQGYELVAGKNGPKLKPSEDVVDSSVPAGPPPGPPGPPKTDARGFPQLERPGLIMMMRIVDKAPIAHLTARAQPLSALVQMLSNQLHRPVVDKTGLTGKYDFTLEFTPEGGGFGPGPGGPPAPSAQGPLDALVNSGPTMQSAVQEQLGLKLEPKKAPLDMLIVDRADKVPTEN